MPVILCLLPLTALVAGTAAADPSFVPGSVPEAAVANHLAGLMADYVAHFDPNKNSTEQAAYTQAFVAQVDEAAVAILNIQQQCLETGFGFKAGPIVWNALPVTGFTSGQFHFYYDIPGLGSNAGRVGVGVWFLDLRVRQLSVLGCSIPGP